MTSLLDRVPAPVAAAPSARSRAAVLEHLVIAAFLLWWALPMTRDMGGRGPGKVPVALLIGVVMLAVTRPWQRVSRVLLGLSAWTAAAALAVCVLAPSGWYGANDAASYGLAALTLPCVIAYARTAERRRVLVAAVVAAGLVQFTDAFLPWWSAGDPASVMTGTFYWWNPFAAYLIPAVVLGAALFVHQRGAWAFVGLLSAPLALSGIVFSSSRACLAVAVVGLVALVVSAASDSGRRKQALIRWIAIVALSVAAPVAISGPPLFDHRVTPLSAQNTRSDAGETLSKNGSERLLFWHQSVSVFEAHPVSGAGYHTLATAAEGRVDDSGGVTALAHNGYLQVLTDGGLVLALPFLLGCGLVLVGAARRLVSARTAGADRWTRIALPVTLAGLAAHSAIDFDWSHPSDLLMTTVLAGLVLALPVRTANNPSSGRRAVGIGAVSVLAVVALLGAFAQHRWDDTKADITSTRLDSAAVAATQLHQLGDRPFADDRFAIALLARATGDAVPTAQGVAPADLRWALDATRTPAEVDRFLQLQRAAGLLVLGDRAGAEKLREQALAGLPTSLLGLHADASAQILAALGHTDAARAALEPYLSEQSEYTGQPLEIAHTGTHLKVLLQLVDGHYTTFDRCAYAAATAAELVNPGTPSPGAVPVGTSCPNVLAGARS